ncbi:MAG: succinate dehydrogenase/fumarate reductase iron-sulfur subunit [Candidatus Obscuribacterales bacterium]|nr:succinate dehydrogenase/fumarate reductase iron-sulfur subunit [Candidatus Obscuribacterales bacterium]
MPEAYNAKLRVYRGDASGGTFKDYTVPVEEGMVVLDAIHYIQREVDPDLAVRWNCKAAKCGSCSAEVNGHPSLMCKTRMKGFSPDETITVQPIQSFPIIKDLVTDVSWNYEQNKRIQPFTPKKDTDWIMYQEDIERVQEFRKCIECFLCQNVCHVLRDNDRKDAFSGPRFMIRVASLEMHPLDDADRLEFLHKEGGIGYCNITKCCTEVCPESIHITDNGIIPMKERVVDEYYDPVAKFLKKVFSPKK